MTDDYNIGYAHALYDCKRELEEEIKCYECLMECFPENKRFKTGKRAIEMLLAHRVEHLIRKLNNDR